MKEAQASTRKGVPHQNDFAQLQHPLVFCL
jgi:hypothetical protein